MRRNVRLLTGALYMLLSVLCLVLLLTAHTQQRLLVALLLSAAALLLALGSITTFTEGDS